jgi:hypothetical protein
VPAFMLLNRMDRANVWVIEGRSGAGLALEALKRLAVLRHFGGKKFQGHAATELGILGFIHHAHATRANLFEDVVMRESLPDKRSRVRHQAHILDGHGR